MQMSDTLVLPPGEDNPRNSEGTFVELRDGRLMFVYSRYRGGNWHADAAADLAARYSGDQGKSWSGEDRIILEHGDALNLMSPSLLRLADGRLMLLFLRKSASVERGVDCMPQICFSQDEGDSWSEPRDVVPFPGYHVVNNDRVIQLQSGRIIVPVAWHRTIDSTRHDSRAIALMFLSDDGGASFREAADWMLPPQASAAGLQEPGAVDLGENRVFAYFRTDQGSQYAAFSDDGGGDHWSVPCPTDFISPLSPMSVKRNPENGDLVALWNDRSERWGDAAPPLESSWMRTPLVLARSSDNGVSWRDDIRIEDDPARGYCYIAMHFTRDGALLLGYCCGGAGGITVLQELKIRRITLA